MTPKRKKLPDEPGPESTPKLTSELAAIAPLVPVFWHEDVPFVIVHDSAVAPPARNATMVSAVAFTAAPPAAKMSTIRLLAPFGHPAENRLCALASAAIAAPVSYGVL